MSRTQMIVGVLEIVFTLLPPSIEIVPGVSKLLSSPGGSLPITRTRQDRWFLFLLNIISTFLPMSGLSSGKCKVSDSSFRRMRTEFKVHPSFGD